MWISELDKWHEINSIKLLLIPHTWTLSSWNIRHSGDPENEKIIVKLINVWCGSLTRKIYVYIYAQSLSQSKNS
jgi:hypothetical protein